MIRMRQPDGRVVQATPNTPTTQRALVEAGVIQEVTEPPRDLVKMFLDTSLTEAQERIQRLISEGTSILGRDIMKLYAENISDPEILGRIGIVFFERLIDIIEGIESEPNLPANTRISGDMNLKIHAVGDIVGVFKESGYIHFRKLLEGMDYIQKRDTQYEDPRFKRTLNEETQESDDALLLVTENSKVFFRFQDPLSGQDLVLMQIEYGQLPFTSSFNEKVHEYMKQKFQEAFDIFLNIVYLTIQDEYNAKK